MSSIGSKVARQGSAASSTAGNVQHQATPATLLTDTSLSIDQSSHNHFFARIRGVWQLSILHRDWLPHTQRHERIMVGSTAMGMAILTREMMEMHIQRTPNVRGMLDCLPVAGKDNAIASVGWRQKLGTWPNSKQYPQKRI